MGIFPRKATILLSFFLCQVFYVIIANIRVIPLVLIYIVPSAILRRGHDVF